MGRRRLTRRFRTKHPKKSSYRRSGQRQRALLVFGLLLAGLVGVRHLAQRSSVNITDSSRGTAQTPTALGLETGDRTALLALARSRLTDGSNGATTSGSNTGAVRAWVSLSRPRDLAWVGRGSGDSVENAVLAAVDAIVRNAPTASEGTGLLKIDLVKAIDSQRYFDEAGQALLDPSLQGLWLPESDLVLLPEELMARRLVNRDGDLQSGRLRRYLEASARPHRPIDGNPGAPGVPYRTMTFDSFGEGLDGLTIPYFRGNDRAPAVNPEALLAAAHRGGDYLARHLNDDGSFNYIYEPRRDRNGDGYNLLRHAGSCYALLELYRVSGELRYREAAQRGIDHLLTYSRPPLPADSAAGFEAIVSPGEEAKLGGAALAILAILEHHDATGEGRWLDRARKLARFILFQQDDDGRFESKYFYGKPDAKPFVSIYYPGEAILALTRLARIDGNARWLEAARRGADYLIDVRDAALPTDELPHDHWLLMGLNELDTATGDPRYLAHATRIGDAILGAQRRDTPVPDWFGTFYDPPRSTPTATRSEALIAMHRLATRNGKPGRPYLTAMMSMAAFQLRCQLNETNSFHLPRPDRAHGGFRRSLTNFEIRIDYVQHNVSALLGLRERLLSPEAAGD